MTDPQPQPNEEELELNQDTAEEQDDVDPRDALLVDLQEQLDQAKNERLLALAESENVRKRTQKEKEDAVKYAVTNFARDLLSVSDNFTRALDSAPKEADDTVKNLILGVEMTQTELQSTFEKHGIKKVSPQGEKFDHHAHQAVVEIPTADAEPGTVVQVMQEGWMLHDRLLRPAMVGVAKAVEGSVDTEA